MIDTGCACTTESCFGGLALLPAAPLSFRSAPSWPIRQCTNAGIEQRIKRAIVPKNTVKTVSEILMLTANKKSKEAVL